VIREAEIVFDEAIDEAAERADDAIDKLEDITPENPEWDRLNSTAERATSDEGLFRWMRDEAHSDSGVDVWDRPAPSITLGGLDAGEIAHVKKHLPADASRYEAKLFIVARGTVRAPYYEPDDDLDENMVRVSDLPDSVVTLLHRKISEMMDVGEGNEQRLERLRRVRESATSTED